MRDTVEVLGIPVDRVTMQEALEKVESFLDENKVHAIYTPNAEIMMAAQRDPSLKNILTEADLLVADGAGVVLAGRILGLGLPERVAGFDLVKNLFSLSSRRKLKFFLLGGKPGIAEAAGKNILRDHPAVEIMGCRNGYFSKEEESSIIDEINGSGADILLVALGAPKQEKWIHAHRHQLRVKACFGIGGSFDIFAGVSKRAPDFFRNNGLEWLYRLYKEPWRFRRMLDLPRFILRAVGARVLGRR